jgi:hypothetical protein
MMGIPEDIFGFFMEITLDYFTSEGLSRNE